VVEARKLEGVGTVTSLAPVTAKLALVRVLMTGLALEWLEAEATFLVTALARVFACTPTSGNRVLE
jgi:hypothetical protein